MSRISRKIIFKESTGRRIIEQSRIRLLCVGLFFILCFTSISVRMVEVAVFGKRQSNTITVADPDNEEKTEQEAQSRGGIDHAEPRDRPKQPQLSRLGQ